MDSQKIKSLFLFLVLTALFFYFGHAIAREPGSSVVQSEQSTRFLDVIAVLDSIQFDFDFINSLGDTSIKTDVYVPPLPLSDSGRDNPFMRSNSSTPFSGLPGVSTDAAVLDDSAFVREEVFGSPPDDVVQRPLDGAVPPQDSTLVFPEDSSPEPEQQEDQSGSPPPASSATLTR